MINTSISCNILSYDDLSNNYLTDPENKSIWDNLDLSEYVIGYKKESYNYELYGVCNHSGGVLGGHYTAYVKNANGKWYHFNDTSVSEVGLNESIVSAKAYVLFYRKKN
jgi:ubiquitin C-terminal hydrolase